MFLRSVKALARRVTEFDNLNKTFCILRLPRSSDTTSTTTTATNDEEHEEPSCLVKRVDFVVSPTEQYPFTLVSWTGSKQFNRSLRRYSAKELNMTVNAHGIYDIAQDKSLVATTEKEVFSETGVRRAMGEKLLEVAFNGTIIQKI